MSRQNRFDIADQFVRIPFSDIERVGQISLLRKDIFCVSWLLGRFCNYKCSYCWPYARSSVPDHRPLSLLIRTMDEIKRQARERGFHSFHFSFSGGEPSLHKGFLDLLKHYADGAAGDKYQSVHMTSNLSRKAAWLEKFASATAGLDRVSVTASYHREFADRKEFADKIITLQENKVHVTINIVMLPALFDVLWEDALFFHSCGINVTLKPQSDSKAQRVVSGYTVKMLSRLRRGLPQRDYEGALSIEKPGEDRKLKSSAAGVSADRAAKAGGESRCKDNKGKNGAPPAPQRKGRLGKGFWNSLRPALFPPVSFAKKLVGSAGKTSAPSLPRPIFQVELTDFQGKSYFIDQAERLNSLRFNRFYGWECSSGFRSLIIREPDGLIKRSYSCCDKPLGHIETGFKLFDKPEPCRTLSCVSSADSKIPKRKPGSKLPLWPETKQSCAAARR